MIKTRAMKKKYIYIALMAAMLSGCDSFLDVTPKGKLLPENTVDFDEMIGDPSLPSGAYPLVDVMGDNVVKIEDVITSSVNGSMGKAYLWMDNFYKEEEDDAVWSGAYKPIYAFNLVLQEVDGSKNGTDMDKKRIAAEARFNRAYYYWFLHSCYAKAYDPATAATDLSVPLRLDADLEIKLSRATSAEVVKQILTDLEHPEDLPVEPANDYRIPRGGAYALAARVHLSLGNYDEALKNAGKALELNSTLLDYNTYSFKNPARPSSGINNRPANYRVSPEKLMYRSCNFTTMMSSCDMSPELLAIYDTVADLRFKFNYTRLTNAGKPKGNPTPTYMQELDYNIGVPEMLLIKAECLARKNDRDALKVLDQLRSCRIAANQFEELNVSTDRLLETVLEERQRELAFHGMRFFDMKRLVKEGKYTRTLIREYKGTAYKLAPNSLAYQLPIGPKVIIMNNNIVQNPR